MAFRDAVPNSRLSICQQLLRLFTGVVSFKRFVASEPVHVNHVYVFFAKQEITRVTGFEQQVIHIHTHDNTTTYLYL